MRTAYLDTLYQLAKKDERVVSLVADNGLIVYDDFRRDFPYRYFNFGISEGNMVSAAAGMASCGKIPFCYTISSFLAYRSYEFIRDDVCFQNQNVKIVGIGSGMAYSTLGPSHHATEDISVLRPLPNLTLFSPGSPIDARNVIRAAYGIDGPVYVRLGTNNESEIYSEEPNFRIGKAEVIREGNDIAIIATGCIVSEVLKTAEQLLDKGISAKVINVHTLKPFDVDLVIELAKSVRSIYTVEEHSVLYGLGSIVAEIIAENGCSVGFHRIGLVDSFAKGYGTHLEVLRINKLDSKGIYEYIMANEQERHMIHMTHNKIVLDGSKVLWHQDRINKWLNGERIAPITIDCALTTKCSYRCIYCYGKMQCINQSDNLDKDVIFNFLDDAAEIGVKAISFVSDGESTCNPHLKDAILRGYSNGLDMALGTNGYLLNDDELAEILPCLTYLRFNISAGEAERYAYIHGCSEKCYYKVCNTIRKAVQIKKENNLNVTIGLQMVLMPDFKDQIIPLTKLGKELGVDYLVIKHCSDDENNTLGVDYSQYESMIDVLKEAESYSDSTYQVTAKWSKILSHGEKRYCKCFGPPFIIQMSGTGLVAPCGMFFNEKYKKYHIGNIKEKRFKDIWNSDRYWEVMKLIASDEFNPNTDCGTLCLQHKTNEVLWDIYNKGGGGIQKAG